MKAMHPCERVGLEFFESAPYRIVHTADFPVPPARLFEVLSDGAAWPQWFEVVKSATWTSPEPHGVGSTRTVVMNGNVTATEEFIAWEPHRHLAFRFNECNSARVRGSAEEYRIETSADGCRLTWTMAQYPVTSSRLMTKLAKHLMDKACRRALVSLREYTDRRFGMVL